MGEKIGRFVGQELFFFYLNSVTSLCVLDQRLIVIAVLETQSLHAMANAWFNVANIVQREF